MIGALQSHDKGQSQKRGLKMDSLVALLAAMGIYLLQQFLFHHRPLLPDMLVTGTIGAAFVGWVALSIRALKRNGVVAVYQLVIVGAALLAHFYVSSIYFACSWYNSCPERYHHSAKWPFPANSRHRSCRLEMTDLAQFRLSHHSRRRCSMLRRA